MANMRKVVKEALGKREANPDMIGKIELEKNDVLALILAMASVAIPVFLLMFAGVALVIFVMFYR
ncbi:MAG: hypothetical protein E6344_03165 [Clostridium sp.]|uniref:hypothetical protein n=1 Tax=Clostridium culturomicium TaxID=1499683 RepID=UPI00058C4557|nr:hypothetical protein [Clostridium culturomicium]MDU4889695.1 hypothetical protein [Clostridium sp.]MDU7082661.1 hypothetical protein [Clostridium sp.]